MGVRCVDPERLLSPFRMDELLEKRLVLAV
jgi:hypothetical protein